MRPEDAAPLMAPTVIRQIALVAGVYLVAFGAVVAWTFRDFAATRARIASSASRGAGEADAFLTRITVLVGVAAAVGTFVTLRTFLIPLPATWILVAAAVADGLATTVGVHLLVRAWPRLAGRDALSELRPVTSMGLSGEAECGDMTTEV